MIDIFLRTDDEDSLKAKIPFTLKQDTEGNNYLVSDTHDYSIDLIGDIYNDDAIYDENGELVTPPTKVDGFHSNIRCKESISSQVPEDIKISNPNTPSRVFFDDK